MIIASVHGSLPNHHYSQDELIAEFIHHWSNQHHNPDRLKRLHEAVQVGGRHLALPLDEYQGLGLGDANNAFISVGTEIGAKAIIGALSQLELEPTDVDAIFTTTVTGIATPSLDARLVNKVGFRNDIKRTPMFGLGCVAGAAGIARLYDYLQAYPNQIAVLLSVELCSLTLQRNDLSVPNLIASGLFGDGAAALIGIGEAKAKTMGLTGPKVTQTRSRFYPDTERVMGWDIEDTGFKIVLSASVPQVVKQHIRSDVDAFLEIHGLTISDISTWVCHPGGPKVLTAFEESLELPPNALKRTWDSLKNVGNLSSASVLFVLQQTLADCALKPGEKGLLLALGPGFCSELVLLEG
ncbi:MAG: type III polyketide synthase [Deltaproteobacteria bacterium]|nr:type III polyketide synthase [Deltaproteobacteria bacterium]